MKKIWSNVLSTSASSSGLMFVQDDSFTYQDLVDWVIRNCEGCVQVIYNVNKDVQAVFEDRIERYYFMEENKDGFGN